MTDLILAGSGGAFGANGFTAWLAAKPFERRPSSAIAPRPSLPLRVRNSRRVSARACSSRRFMASVLGQDGVEIEEHIGHHGVGSGLGGLAVFRQGTERLRGQLRGAFLVSLVSRQLLF